MIEEPSNNETKSTSVGAHFLSVKRRLCLGFGVLVVLLTLSGVVSLWQIDRIDTALMQIVEVEEPLEEAVLEMEIHAGETARAVLHHVHEPKAKYREHALRSEDEFQTYSRQFTELVENEDERRIGSQVFATYAEFKALGDELMEISSRRIQSLKRLRRDVTEIDHELSSVANQLTEEQSEQEVQKLAAALRMEVEIEKAFAVVESYMAMRDPNLIQELDQAIDHFQEQAEQFRGSNLTVQETETLKQLELQFGDTVSAARQSIQLTDRLDDLSDRFEADLFEMDSVLDDDIQPLIHAETVRAAEDAMNSSRRAIMLLACLSVSGVIVGGFLGWHISRGITEPVNRLVRGTQIIQGGNREHRIEVDTKDEFGELASAFNGMVDSLNQSTEELLQSQQEAEQLKLEAAQQEIEHHAAAARTDQLTQLPNRRAFDDMIAFHTEELTTGQGKVGLILFDVDRFKKFNDDYGHQAGDVVLQGVANVLATVFQAPDFAARFGGEEFAAILPNCTLDEAAYKAEQARTEIERATFDFEGLELSVTASGGVALLDNSQEIDAAIKQADEALYVSKNAGRNAIHLCNDGSFLPVCDVQHSSREVKAS